MTDGLNLIEKIAQNQAEIAADLDSLKESGNQFADDIEALRQHQACAAEAVEDLRRRMQTEVEQNAS